MHISAVLVVQPKGEECSFAVAGINKHVICIHRPHKLHNNDVTRIHTGMCTTRVVYDGWIHSCTLMHYNLAECNRTK